MHSGKWLAASIVVLMTLTSVPLSGETPVDRPDDDAAARADAPWLDIGWKVRAPVVIDNSKNPSNLTDFQVALDIPYDKDMKADFSDLRFVQYAGGANNQLPFWLESRESGKKARAYINVSSIAGSASTTVYMYFGNPSADNASDGASTFLFFDDFEDGQLDGAKWGPLHAGDAGVTVSESGGKLDFTVSGSYQWTGGNIVSRRTLPKDNYVLETKLKFTNYYQSAYGAYAGFTNASVFVDDNYANPLDIVSARLWDYTKNGWYLALSADDIGSVIYGNTNINIRNVWYRMKTYYTPGTYAKAVWNMLEAPYTNQSLDMTGSGGIDPNYIILGVGEYNTAEDTYFDHVLLRKYAAFEPELSIGAKERPYTFRSFGLAPLDVSQGDTVVLTATIDNPIDLAIPVNVSFREGDDFADSTEMAPSKQVVLQPKIETDITLDWPAAGGNHTFWFLLEGSLMASASIGVNWLPTIDSIPNQMLMQGISFSLHITARDNDNERLNWSEDSAMFNFQKTDNKGADISFLPSNDDVGAHTVNFTVADPHGRSASRTVVFSVANNNDVPVLDFIPDMTVMEDGVLSYKANASDPDQKWGDTLTFSDDSTLFEIDTENGNFTFVPTNEQVGKYTVEIAVSDNQTATATRRFSINVLNFNDPPSIDPIAPQKATQNKLWQLIVTATDPDQANIAMDRLRFMDDSPLFDINATSGLITFKPANKDVGARDCNITVTDLSGASATAQLSITVQNVNDPPALDAVAEQVATEDQPFELTLKASDIDVPLKLDNLTFSDESDLFDIDQKTGRFGFTPTNAQVGRYTVNVRVTDESGEFASRAFMLTVQNVNDPPVNLTITSFTAADKFKEGELIWFNGSASDIDAGDRLAYSWLDNGVELGTGRSYQSALPPGNHVITLQVSDGNATVQLGVEIKVAKKELPVTVAGASAIPWPAIVAVLAIAAVAGGVFALARRRKKEPAATSREAGKPGGMPPEAEIAPAAAVAPAPGTKPPPKDAGREEEAKKAIAALEDSLADLIADGKDASDIEEDLDLARDALKEGDYAATVQFANMAQASLARAGSAKKEESGPDVGKLKCPGCDEELQPEWPTCPVCGYKTRGE